MKKNTTIQDGGTWFVIGSMLLLLSIPYAGPLLAEVDTDCFQSLQSAESCVLEVFDMQTPSSYLASLPAPTPAQPQPTDAGNELWIARADAEVH